MESLETHVRHSSAQFLKVFFGSVAPVGGFVLQSALARPLPLWLFHFWLFFLCPAGLVISVLCIFPKEEPNKDVKYYLGATMWTLNMLAILAIGGFFLLIFTGWILPR